LFQCESLPPDIDLKIDGEAGGKVLYIRIMILFAILLTCKLKPFICIHVRVRLFQRDCLPLEADIAGGGGGGGDEEEAEEEEEETDEEETEEEETEEEETEEEEVREEVC
jgi:hypothetical protein